MPSKKINLAGKEFLMIDLTEPISEETEVYPGDPKVKREIISKIEETGWEHYIHHLSDHHFHPHCDAPKHQNKDMQDKGVEIFNTEVNQTLLIDVSPKKRIHHRNKKNKI